MQNLSKEIDFCEPQQHPTINVLSPKGSTTKKALKTRETSKKEGGSQKQKLGFLYTQLNTLLVNKDGGGSNLLSHLKERKAVNPHRNNKDQQSLALVPSSSQHNINEKKLKLSTSIGKTGSGTTNLTSC